MNKNRTIQDGHDRESITADSQAIEASKMLEAALQQMDGIISSATSNVNISNETNQTYNSAKHIKKSSTESEKDGASMSSSSMENVMAISRMLASALQKGGNQLAPDPTSARVIGDWLEQHLPRQSVDERLRQLQHELETVVLQNKMLTDRVSDQGDKIIELEGRLTEKTQQLSIKDEQLERQLLSRSVLETQRLELITALSELKLYSTALECGNLKAQREDHPSDRDLSSGSANVKRIPVYGSTGNLMAAAAAAAATSASASAAYSNSDSGGSGSDGSTNRGRNTLAAMKGGNAVLSHYPKHLQFNSLPRLRMTRNNNNNNNTKNSHTFDTNANERTMPCKVRQRNVAFASTEKVLIEDNFAEDETNDEVINDKHDFQSSSSSNSTPTLNLRERSVKSLCSILGILRRTNSGHLQINSLEHLGEKFKRGGARATAGGRLEWTSSQSGQSALYTKNYAEWSVQDVCSWLSCLGLGCYEDNCRKWLKNNETSVFFAASPFDLEKELILKSPLHRKKLQLAIDELCDREDDPLALKAAALGVPWVVRWLDDIGLPQYKDTFLMAKIDGRMLHRLTMEDLAYLQINSCLHIASLRRGIQIMREMQWDPECLIRRSKKTWPPTVDVSSDSKDELASSSGAVNEVENVALWTAHRVMEWLRVVDLSEYAPNLRGAGVHGALMMYELRFNSNLLADLLCISAGKTLLRRHLATHFKELLGRDVIQAKRDAEESTGYQALTISSRIKPLKKAQFSLKLRKISKDCQTDIEWSEYVCPMEGKEQQLQQQHQQLNSL